MLILISFWLKTISRYYSSLPTSSAQSSPTSSAPPSLPCLLLPPYLTSSNHSYLISSILHTSPAPASYIVCAGLTSASEEVPVGLKRERGSVCSTRHCLSLRITIYTCFITSTVLRKHRSPTLPPRENPPRSPENPPREPPRVPAKGSPQLLTPTAV